MKILQVNKLYYPHIGGIETVIQNMAEGLKDRTNMQVLVCQEKGKTREEKINGVNVTRCGSLGVFFSMPVSFSFLTQFRKKSRTADIVHIHMPFPLADVACLLSGYRGKVVLSWHSDVVKQKKLMLIYKPFMQWLLKRANKIIVATEGHINGSAYLKPYREKCVIIPYGIKTDDYKCIRQENFLKLSDSRNKKILFIGRLVYYKGTDVLINALAQTKGSEVFIVGKGTLEAELKEQVRKLGLEERVHFLGVLEDTDIKKALNDCDFFVLPSVANSEAFGIVQSEAMICGKPVINTSLPTGVPYVSIDNETGFTVPPQNISKLAEAIQELTDNDDLRNKFGFNAEKRAREQFSMEKMLDDTERLYAGLLNNRQGI